MKIVKVFLFIPSFVLFTHCFCFLKERTKEEIYQKIFQENPVFISDGFDFPVGAPNAKKYYDAQPFGKNSHLGEDWNRVDGMDLGEPVYASSNGIVSFVQDIGGGWGNVVRIVHCMPDGKLYETLYAHFQTVIVKPNAMVLRGQKIGTIGDAGGKYSPHLHFELREDIHLPVGHGYSVLTAGYLNPKEFIKKNRKLEVKSK
ncbi:MAG TPA: M23 family metallopeptidase [Leptospiraceae bacterium]|nr:M23 family metallopeptidase [Leptospiraceae bacterium]HMW05990.1 M23 family metallopeptidase [Leptospiraceae bacterium]HMX32078.1 M23 family metallopeptidase [Leptospiraceae bacterium]HMY32344.1 M23 family metallopeptidase [Leptospiraceae bacterium]HMZ62454.1 M23 family metallopeptidase [Leptospiraceae bacterium]